MRARHTTNALCGEITGPLAKFTGTRNEPRRTTYVTFIILPDCIYDLHCIATRTVDWCAAVFWEDIGLKASA
jgi:hypothetical protein